jgi:V/A-type H+-transporting ATPase subunit I
MRKDVKKLLFVGVLQTKQRFFEKAQELGCIHFIAPKNTAKEEIPAELERVSAALEILHRLPAAQQDTSEDVELCAPVVAAIIDKHMALTCCIEQESLLQQEYKRWLPLGSFQSSDLLHIEHLSGCKVQLYCSKPGLIADEELPVHVLRVASELELDYFIAFNRVPWQDCRLTEMHMQRSLQEIRGDLQYLAAQKVGIEAELQTYARYIRSLQKALIEQLNCYSVDNAQKAAQIKASGHLFAIEGWVPEHQLPLLHVLTQELGIHSEEIRPDTNEITPTYLENSGVAQIGEDLVHIYDTPSSNDKDPSVWVLCFFSLFFAIIVGDAGYGALILALALFCGWRYGPLNFSQKKVWKLAVILASTCMVWGVLAHSYFGAHLAPDHPLLKVSLVSQLASKKMAYHTHEQDVTFIEWQENYPAIHHDATPTANFLAANKHRIDGSAVYEMFDKFCDQVLMEIALAIGVLHIIASMMRYAARSKTNIFWALCVIGGYLYLPGYLQATSMWQYIGGISIADTSIVGGYLLTVGATGAVLTAIITQGWRGVFEIFHGSQVFSDVLSYIRLYALAIAGAIMGSTINELAPLLGTAGAIVIILFGHLFNIVLSVMGGITHGLRLNFLEWYHYSFEGEGKPFQALAKIPNE